MRSCARRSALEKKKLTVRRSAFKLPSPPSLSNFKMMKITIDPALCMHCQSCIGFAPKVIEEGPQVRADADLSQPESRAQAELAKKACPAGAIEISES